MSGLAYRPISAKSPHRMSTFWSRRETARRLSASQIRGLAYLPWGTLNRPFAFTRYRPLKQVRFRKMNRAAVVVGAVFLMLNSVLLPRKYSLRLSASRVRIFFLQGGELGYQSLNVCLDHTVCANQLRVDVVDYCVLYVGILLQEPEEYSSASYERFDIGEAPAGGNVRREGFAELFQKLSFSSDPFYEWTGLCIMCSRNGIYASLYITKL